MEEPKKEHLGFDEYLRQGEPQQREKAALWRTAIGLQQVDGLSPSEFLLSEAQRNIEGEISIEEVQKQLRSYYETKSVKDAGDDDKEEADKVSANIAKILSSRTFSFNENGVISLHRRIFEGVFKHAGSLREYNITKKEWVLDGDTVSYLNWEDLKNALHYDIEQEKQFSYQGLTEEQIIVHLTKFVSGIWQIHPFKEGNTRTTAVFVIQYLRSIGFEVNNEMFARHSWYFRNALVRANYKNVKLGIDYTPVYLERFFKNLLLGDTWILKNRYLHIHPSEEWKNQPKEQKVEKMVDKVAMKQEMVDKWGVKPTLAGKMVDILAFVAEVNIVTTEMVVTRFGFSETSAKRHLRQLSEFGYLEAHGGNRNKTYTLK